MKVALKENRLLIEVETGKDLNGGIKRFKNQKVFKTNLEHQEVQNLFNDHHDCLRTGGCEGKRLD